MGGGGDTRKTLEQVQQELLLTLFNNANKLVNPSLPVPNPVTVEDLQEVLTAAAEQSFKAFYGYEFNGEGSQPPTAIGSVGAADALCNITSAEGTQIEDYVKGQVLNSAKLQNTWIYDSACTDLVNQGNLIFGTATANNWLVNNFGKYYNSPQATDSSYRADLELIYCTASLTDDGTTAQYAFIYYIGVYYEVIQPEKAVLSELVGILANNGNNLLTSVGLPKVPLQSPPVVQDIQTILGNYCGYEFEKLYGFAFNYNQTNPPDIATDTPVPEIRGSNALCYLTDDLKEVADLGIYVDTKILSAMNLPPWVLAGHARDALVQELTALISTNTGNNWTQAPFVASYNSAALLENSYKTASVIGYTNASLIQGSINVNVTLLNYMGVYYQIESPNVAATQGLLDVLCRNANDLLSQPVGIHDPPTNEDLQSILDVFAPIEFDKLFDFQYLGGNSQPPDAASTKQPFNNQSFLFLPPDQLTHLQSYIDTSILAGLGLPYWAKSITRPDLFEIMTDITNEAKVNTWNWTKFQQTYENTANPFGNNVKTTALFVYTNATVVQNGQEVTATFIYYLGLYYGVLPDVDAERKLIRF